MGLNLSVGSPFRFGEGVECAAGQVGEIIRVDKGIGAELASKVVGEGIKLLSHGIVFRHLVLGHAGSEVGGVVNVG